MSTAADSISVLCVDDDPDLVDLTASYLERQSDRIAAATATSGREGLNRLAETDFDCLVADYDMPEMDGIEFLASVREDYHDLPFILFTGKGSEEVASEAISAGATDYVRKAHGTEQYELLANRVRNAVEQYRATRRAAELTRIRTLASDVTQGLVRATSRADAEARVCEIISDADPYLFAWIGDVATGTDRVEPRASAGAGDGYLAEITVTADDEPTGRGPVGTAVRARRVAVSQDVRTDPAFEPWRDAATERGYRAVAAVPLESGDAFYGVLVVYANRPDVFDAEERDLLGELGADVAHVFRSFDVQERLRTERDQREALFENAPTPVIAGIYDATDGSNQILAANDAFESVFGYDAGEMVGRDVVDAIVPEERSDEHQALRERVTRHETTVAEVERLTDDGPREFLLHVVPYETEAADTHGWYAWYTDISGPKRRQQKLTALHDVATDLETGTSIEYICERTVEASQEILAFDLSGIDIEEDGYLTKAALSEEVPVEDTTAMPVEEGIAGKTYRTGESLLIDDVEEHGEAQPQGPFRSAISIPIGEHGVFQAVAEAVGAFDESDLELAELLLSHTESALDRVAHERQLERQNERLDEFASVVSHELRNPLNVASGRVEIVSREYESEHLDVALRAHERMEALIDDLLALARDGERAMDVESVRLDAAVDRCWQNVATDEATLVVETDRTVRADRSRLQQLLENLIRNSVEHGGSAVAVTVGDLEDGFFVEDDGVGIPPDERADVFDIGYSSTREGTGFGLSIVEETADAHGWDVRLTENRDGGARFEITGAGSGSETT